MAKMEKIRSMQVVDNKVNKFFCFPMISMVCTGSGYEKILIIIDCQDFFAFMELTNP
jgi:hypothetical protein